MVVQDPQVNLVISLNWAQSFSMNKEIKFTTLILGMLPIMLCLLINLLVLVTVSQLVSQKSPKIKIKSVSNSYMHGKNS